MRQQKQPISENKRLANQRNAQKSTGPRTPEGKAKSSQNARTHGLFCQEIVLMHEDRSLFKQLRLQHIRDLKPQLLIELSLVDKIVECQWKMRRMRVNEAVRCERALEKHLEQTGRAGMQNVSTDKPDYCAPTAMGLLLERNEDGLERISKYEQRLQNQVHKCLRELRVMRDEQEKIAALPDSPFEETVEEIACDLEEEAEKETSDDSAERSQPASHASPSPQPLLSHAYMGTHSEGEGEMQNEAIGGRRFDADVSWGEVDAVDSST